MLRLTLAVGVACAVVLTHPVGAQNGTSGGSMPGQAVGVYRGKVNPVGTKAPAAAPQAGESIAGPGQSRPYDPTRPYDAFKGTGIDPANVLAPVVGPDGKPVAPPDGLDRLSAKIREYFVRTPPPPRPPYTPGITRRTRERNDHTWRRD